MLQREDIERLDNKKFNPEETNIINELMKDSLVYLSVLREIQTKIEILREDFKRTTAYNPIEHIKGRIKEPSSILKKVYLRNLPLNYENIMENLNDIVGIRIVCTFKSDIYKISNIIQNLTDIEIIQIKDYIKNPKESGYQSYHLIVKIPVEMISGRVWCKVEIQLRTMAMDFWACLEHKIKYKYVWNVPIDIKEELYECSKVVDILDDKMLNLHNKVHDPFEKQIESNL